MKRSPIKTQRGPQPMRRDRSAEFLSFVVAPPSNAVMVRADGAARLVVAVPKECVIEEHPAYMTTVRGMACYRCGVAGFTQFCHADEGKGLSIKTDCRRGWPGCGPCGGFPGCHWVIGTSGIFTREFKRAFEAQAGKATRAAVHSIRMWPLDLPAWPEDTKDPA